MVLVGLLSTDNNDAWVCKNKQPRAGIQLERTIFDLAKARLKATISSDDPTCSIYGDHSKIVVEIKQSLV